MDLTRYDTTYEKYLENIILTPTQTRAIDRALISLSELFASAYEGRVDIYLQGSFATNTTVKPLTANQSKHGAGEFDIDIVLERTSWGGAVSSLDEIKQILLDDDDYSSLVSRQDKNSCVRIEFPPDVNTGVGFHVDLVPISFKNGERRVASRSDKDWNPSDPKKLVDWTQTLLNDNPYIASHIISIKRMRDCAGLTRLIPSIVILALVAKKYKNTGSYAGDLINFLEEMDLLLSLGIEYVRVANPVDIRESIISQWENDPRVFEAVKSFFEKSLSDLRQAFEQQDMPTAQRVLSDDFPSELLPENVDSLRSESITLATNGEFGRYTIDSTAPHGKKIKDNFWLFFERSKAIKFELKYQGDYSQILWQVCNSRQSEKLRGDLFKARALGQPPGTSPDPLINHENELYLGTHWIRAYVIDRTNQAVAVGTRVYVQVKKSAEPAYRTFRR